MRDNVPLSGQANFVNSISLATFDSAGPFGRSGTEKQLGVVEAKSMIDR